MTEPNDVLVPRASPFRWDPAKAIEDLRSNVTAAADVLPPTSVAGRASGIQLRAAAEAVIALVPGIDPQPKAEPLALRLSIQNSVLANVAALDDSTIASLYAENRADSSDIRDRHAQELAPFAHLENALTIEIERRLKERRTDPDSKVAIPHPQLIIELEPQFGSYIFNVDGLRRAAAMLAPEEARKLVRYTPAHTDPVPEKWEPGPTASIKAIRDKYPGSDIAKILGESMDRPRVGDRLTIKPREVAPKNVTPTEELE